jgi:hypothetical protein
MKNKIKRWGVMWFMLSGTIVVAAWVGVDEEKTDPQTKIILAKEDVVSIDQLKRSSSSPQQDAFSGKSWVVAKPMPKPAPVVLPVAVAPPLPYTYMGKMQESSGQLIIYLVRGDKPYIVKEGDVLDDAYRVEKVEAGRITFTYMPMAATQVLQTGAN